MAGADDDKRYCSGLCLLMFFWWPKCKSDGNKNEDDELKHLYMDNDHKEKSEEV